MEPKRNPVSFKPQDAASTRALDQLRLEAAVSAPVARPFPLAVKAALFVGGPVVGWVAIAYLVTWVCQKKAF